MCVSSSHCIVNLEASALVSCNNYCKNESNSSLNFPNNCSIVEATPTQIFTRNITYKTVVKRVK